MVNLIYGSLQSNYSKAIFLWFVSKRNNICYSLITCLDNESIPNWELLIKENNASRGANLFPLKLDHIKKGTRGVRGVRGGGDIIIEMLPLKVHPLS